MSFSHEETSGSPCFYIRTTASGEELAGAWERGYDRAESYALILILQWDTYEWLTYIIAKCKFVLSIRDWTGTVIVKITP